MPTVLRIKGYRFFFFSREPLEPSHIHVEEDDKYAKYWLNPVSLASSFGFKAHELKQIGKIVEQNSPMYRRVRNEYFKQ
jgi:hypothetical protein